MPRYPFESEFLYGLHEPGGESIMRDAGCRGWILFTEEIGSDPSHQGGSQSYGGLSAEGFGIMVRLNNGYYPNGTIPHSSKYEGFAQRCAHFVRNSPGAKMVAKLQEDMSRGLTKLRSVRVNDPSKPHPIRKQVRNLRFL